MGGKCVSLPRGKWGKWEMRRGRHGLNVADLGENGKYHVFWAKMGVFWEEGDLGGWGRCVEGVME